MSVPVYDQLRALILSDEFGPDTMLVETALAGRLGVSRTPIREALRRLEQDGLVERTSRGTRVVERSPEQILEIYELRILLEGQAARTAAERATSLDINRLRAIHEQMLSAGPDDDDDRVRLNRLFHEALWAASHNGTLVEVIERLIAHLHPQTTLRYPGRWDSILKEHGELLQAITEHRADDAAAIATEHMTQAREIRLQLDAGAVATGSANAGQSDGDQSGQFLRQGRRRRDQDVESRTWDLQDGAGTGTHDGLPGRGVPFGQSAADEGVTLAVRQGEEVAGRRPRDAHPPDLRDERPDDAEYPLPGAHVVGQA